MIETCFWSFNLSDRPTRSILFEVTSLLSLVFRRMQKKKGSGSRTANAETPVPMPIICWVEMECES